MTPRRARAALLLALLLASCVVRRESAGDGTIPVAEALDLVARGQAVFVDLRGADAYARGHLPGAVNVPFPDVVGRAAELRRMRLPILYCG